MRMTRKAEIILQSGIKQLYNVRCLV